MLEQDRVVLYSGLCPIFQNIIDQCEKLQHDKKLYKAVYKCWDSFQFPQNKFESKGFNKKNSEQNSYITNIFIFKKKS